MESVLGRYRNLIILVGVLFLQVLGLAMQVKRVNTQAKDTRLIRVWAVGAVTPFERVLVWFESGTGNIWHNYFYLRGVRAENRQLKGQIEQMRLEQVRLTEDAAQARRLQTLLAFKEQFISRTVAAQVIGSGGSDSSRIVYIDKGEQDGLAPDMAVITADGIVGKVLQAWTTPRESQVLLINDQSSGVGAILEKTRLQGVLRGTANGEITLERVMSDEQVPVGETVLTSGGDRIFPKGLHVGTVTRVGSGKDLFLNIKIKPAADLSRLEEVLVLTEKQERQSIADDSPRVRAADILAQRLPSVPDKPAADAASVGVPSEGSPKPTTAVVAPQTAGAKTAGVTATGVKAAGATVPSTSPASKSPVAGGSASTQSAAKPAQPKKTADSNSTAPKTNPTSTPAGSKPQASPAKPANSQVLPAKPAPPPPNSPSPTAETSPN
jgi:rod shape-determining protein MreC